MWPDYQRHVPNGHSVCMHACPAWHAHTNCTKLNPDKINESCLRGFSTLCKNKLILLKEVKLTKSM